MFLLFRQLVVVEVFNLLGINVAVVDVLLLLGFVLFSLLNADFLLPLNEEGVLLSKVNLEQLYKLKLVRLPGGRELMFKLG